MIKCKCIPRIRQVYGREEFNEDHRFAKKFKSFIEQYELREIQFNADMRTKEAEALLYLAKFEQEKKRADQAEERARALNAQVTTFSRTETELRSQLNIYVEKFKQVRDKTSLDIALLKCHYEGFLLELKVEACESLSCDFLKRTWKVPGRCNGRSCNPSSLVYLFVHIIKI